MRGRIGDFADGVIDLGTEPPLTLMDQNQSEQGPLLRSVSWRWLAGTVLTGVTSILLMGTALTAALNNPNQFATLPASIAAGFALNQQGFGQKGDRVQPAEERVSNRQILQVSTVTRQGERDFIRLRPFARIDAGLSPRRGELAAAVPAYDALRIFADTSAPEPPATGPETTVASDDDQLYGANVDGEVAVRVSAFPAERPDLEPTVNFTSAEAEQIVRLHVRGTSGSRASLALAFASAVASEEDVLSLDSLTPGVSIIPENLSSITKSGAGSGLSETVVAARSRDDLLAVLAGKGTTEEEVSQMVAALSRLVDVDNLSASGRIRIGQAAAADDAAGPRTMRVSVYRDGAHQATIARNDGGFFVRADEPSSLFNVFANAELEPEPQTSGGSTIYQAVYEAALGQEIPGPLIDQLVRIFAFDVDFQARTSAGDSLDVFHSLPDKDDVSSGGPEILYAALTHDGVAKRFYRFRTPDDGVVDYYDQEGKSAKKFLLRKPVTEGRMRSRYGMRRHPVLGVRRLHAGVDYAAKRGTPILAAGNGVVKQARRSSGYGNFTVIRHTNGYETAYAHQNRFAKGMKKGARVRQGQVIGYVGSTGLSTGPHLHYEIRVNGKAVNPLRIRLPRGRVLQGELLTGFERERQRIDKLLGIDEQTQLASN
ncbi:MAG: M23 family metallopeptidase [Alphaproteobacteria bacterium]